MTLIELIEALIAVNLLGFSAVEGSDEEKIHADRAEELDLEITRRLAEVRTNFKSTEAVRINLVLDTGSDAGWRS
jgi:hypothetical protein